MDTIELSKWASPDFSAQGILESYHSLIDLMEERYSFTAERGLDWEQIRQTYLPAWKKLMLAKTMVPTLLF